MPSDTNTTASSSSSPAARITASLAGTKIRQSCDNCKNSKIKCGQEKPACRRCRDHSAQCVYSPSRRMGRPRAGKGKHHQQACKDTSSGNDKGNFGDSSNIGSKNASSLATSSSQGTPDIMILEGSPPPMSCAPHETVFNMPPQQFFTGQTDFPMLSTYTDEAALADFCFALEDTGSSFYNSPLDGSDSLQLSDNPFLDSWDLTADSWSASTSNLGNLHAETAATANALVEQHSGTSGQAASTASIPEKEGVCAAAVLIERTQQEQANLNLNANEDRQSCQMGAILVACEQLSDQMAAIDECGECSTRISTTLAECHAAGFIARILSEGVSHCVQALAADKDKRQPHVSSIEVENTPQQTGSQMIRLGSYQVHFSASQELLRTLVRRRLRLLQTKLEMLTDMRSGWSRPGSPSEEILIAFYQNSRQDWQCRSQRCSCETSWKGCVEACGLRPP